MQKKSIFLMKKSIPFTFTSLIILNLLTGCLPQPSTPTAPTLKLNKEHNTTALQTKDLNETTHERYSYFAKPKELLPKEEEEITPLNKPLNEVPLNEIINIVSLEENLLTSTLTTSMLSDVDLISEEVMANENNVSEQILATAEMFLGVKYVWAANGPNAFDCSGFTKYVFKENGINLPRYSGNQANIGEKINFEALQTGDLVFFDTHKKFQHKVNHVGIYIGNHQFIHASSAKKKVIITSFDEKKFYKKKFLYARRITPQSQTFAFQTKITDHSTLVN